MPKINLLDKSVAELIAAGEVVERPASVAKELIENSIDAGATHITIELRRGGISLLRITDDGCGIERADVAKAFLRHATSKVKSADDLDAISTLGFRGEALAATATVSKIELITKSRDEDIGTHYMIEGGVEILSEDTGCPDGTTIIVSDLFYNTPARMKFLKKDVSEGNAVAAVVDRVALSHPEISFKFIREGKQVLSTSGDGELSSAVYSVLGRDFAKSVIPISSNNNGISVGGLICKPIFCRNSRSLQFVFLNGRFVQSGTVTAAAEQAYKNSAMVGKFPAFVINVSVPYGTVDVNVHPAKTQVRFSDEKRIFEAVYSAVKSGLSTSDTRPIISPKPASAFPAFSHISTNEYRQEVMKVELQEKPTVQNNETPSPKKVLSFNDGGASILYDKDFINISNQVAKQFTNVSIPIDDTQSFKHEKKGKVAETIIENNTTVDDDIRLIGEAFKTYIIVEKGTGIFLIDKHAAHERIIFEKLKSEQKTEIQELLAPVRVKLSKEEYDAAVNSVDILLKAGFEIEDFGNGTIIVRSVPAALINSDISSIVEEAASSILKCGSVENERLDNLYHTIACKAATKSGYHTTDAEMLALAKQVLGSRDIMYCPHGRPVAFEIKRNELEKHFGRIQ